MRPGTEAAADRLPVAGRKAPRPRRPVWLWGGVTGLVLALAVEVGDVLFGRNLHALIPGRVYRCAQQPGEGLARMVRELGIRTVVNLRGCCPSLPWYLDECRTTHRLNVSQEDVCLSSGRLPSVPELRRLVEVLDRTDYPVLLHCKRGSDRTGLASAVVLLLQTDATLSQARRQLGLRFGHLALSKPAYLDQFLDLYADWLATGGLAHSPARLRHWLEHEYTAGACRCTVEFLDAPADRPRGQPSALRVRVHNTAVRPWRLRPAANAGIHAGFILCDARDHFIATGRAGLFDANVAPGQSIDLTLVLPALQEPGAYRVLVDMVDERQCWFYQAGSEPLEQEFTVLSRE
jgi:hypothetical protein